MQEMWKSYGAPAAIVSRGDWIDRPSVSIPTTYVGTALLLAEALDKRGRGAEAERIRQRAIEIAEASRTVDMFLAPTDVPRAPLPAVGDVPGGVELPRKP